jgi:hypothetical protein
MQWRRRSCGQRRPHWCRLAAQRFFRGAGGGTILGRRDCRRRGFRSVRRRALGCDHRWFLLWRRHRVRLLLLLLFNLFRFLYRSGRSTALRVDRTFSVHALAHQFRNRFVDRAGVRLFFGDADLRQHFYDHVRWNLQLPRQLVDADFAHI